MLKAGLDRGDKGKSKEIPAGACPEQGRMGGDDEKGCGEDISGETRRD